MRTAIALRNVVGKTEDIFLIGFCPLQGNFDSDILLATQCMYDGIVYRSFRSVQMIDECADTTFIFECIGLL